MINSKHGLSVALGGMLGTLLRYLIFTVLPWNTLWTTLLCNITGAFMLAVLYSFIESKVQHQLFQLYRHLFGMGFLGGYTTFSTISLDFALLIEQGNPSLLMLYAMLTFIGGILAAWGGYKLIHSFKRGGC